jgi:FAD synthase
MLSFQGTNNWPREWEINEGFLFDCGKGNTNPWTMRKELENSAVKKQKEANKWNKKIHTSEIPSPIFAQVKSRN